MAKRARAFLKNQDGSTGKYAGLVAAAQINAENRENYVFKCKDDHCNCTYHWQKPTPIASERHRKKAGYAGTNIDIIPAKFVKNKGQRHSAACQKNDPDLKNSKPYQIMFPLGLNTNDDGKRLKLKFNEKNDTRHLRSLSELLNVVALHSGDITDKSQSGAKFIYGRDVKSWGDLWADNAHYSKLLEHGLDGFTGKYVPHPLVTSLRIEQECTPPDGVYIDEEKPQRFFTAVAMPTHSKKFSVAVRPVVSVPADSAICGMMEKFKAATMAIAARPFALSDPKGAKYNDEIDVLLGLGRENQIAMIDGKYWRPIEQQLI